MIGIDLFAGAGGMSLGAKQSGIEIEVVVESDEHAVRTYNKNFRLKKSVHPIDIRKFKPKKLCRKDKQVILFGGPPCQGFSISNQKTRNSNNNTNWLFLDFLRLVKFYLPDWIVMENVKGILETEGGFFVVEIKQRLEKIGYTVNFDILNSADFGVPQKRSRFFLVASLNSGAFRFPERTKKKPVTVKEAIGDLPYLRNGASEPILPYRYSAATSFARKMRKGSQCSANNFVTKNSDLVIDRYKCIPQGGNWEDISEELMSNYRDRARCHTGVYRRLESDAPSTVIGNYRKNMLIHPTQHRGLSVREAARIQSFPDTFTFTGSIGFQQQQVGNAVPPLLAKAVFKKIVDASG